MVECLDSEDDMVDLTVFAPEESSSTGLTGEWALWVRQSNHPAVGPFLDILLLAPDESRDPEAIFAELAPTAEPVPGLDTGNILHVGAALDEAEVVAEEAMESWLHIVPGGITFGDPDFVDDSCMATDGRSVLVGQWSAQMPGEGFGEWVQGQGPALR